MTSQSLRANPWVTVVVLSLGLFMNLLDSTIVYVATPNMLTELHATLDQVLWVYNGFLLPYAVFLIPASRLGDLFGPQRVFFVGVLVFTAASAACGFSSDATQLVTARVVQGTGAALLTPQMLPFISALFPANRRGAAFGLNGAIVGLATVSGPVLGGFIVTNASWRWIFFINVPVGVVTIIATALFVPDLRPGRSHSLDLMGVLLAGSGLAAVVFGLIEGQRYTWSTIGAGITIPELIAAGLVLFAIFLFWESRQREPLVPLSLFRVADYSISNWILMAVAFGMQAAFIPFAVYAQSVLGMSALDSGLTFAPLSIAAPVVSLFAGRFTDRIGGRPILAAGMALFGAGLSWMACIATTDSTGWTFVGPMLMAGVGLGCVFAPNVTVAMRPIVLEMAGSASGVLNTTRQVGAAIGAAVVGAVLQERLATGLRTGAVASVGQLPEQLRQPFVDGVARATRVGLEAGAGQAGHLDLSAGIQPALAAQMQALAARVFDMAFVAAMRPALMIAVAVLLAGAVSALFLEHSWRRRETLELAA